MFGSRPLLSTFMTYVCGATQAPVSTTTLCHNFVCLLNREVRVPSNRILDNLSFFNCERKSANTPVDCTTYNERCTTVRK